MNTEASQPTQSMQVHIGSATPRVEGLVQHLRNGSLVIDVKVLQRHGAISFPVVSWDDVVKALADNGGLKISYLFKEARGRSVKLPVKLLSISSDYSAGPNMPVYDLLRFVPEAENG